MLCFRGEKHKQMLLWTCLPVGWCTPAPGDLPALRKRASPTSSTAGFRCWPGHSYTVVEGLRAAFGARLLRARERELGWLILFPTVTSSIQVTARPRTVTAALTEDGVCRFPWFLRLSACKIQSELILEASADFRGQSYQPESLTTILKRIPWWLYNLELTVCPRHHLIS